MIETVALALAFLAGYALLWVAALAIIRAAERGVEREREALRAYVRALGQRSSDDGE